MRGWTCDFDYPLIDNYNSVKLEGSTTSIINKRARHDYE